MYCCLSYFMVILGYAAASDLSWSRVSMKLCHLKTSYHCIILFWCGENKLVWSWVQCKRSRQSACDMCHTHNSYSLGPSADEQLVQELWRICNLSMSLSINMYRLSTLYTVCHLLVEPKLWPDITLYSPVAKSVVWLRRIWTMVELLGNVFIHIILFDRGSSPKWRNCAKSK